MVIILLSSGGAHFPNIECEAGKVTPYSEIKHQFYSACELGILTQRYEVL